MNKDTRVAIVTGGSGGIGRAVVRRLAADGFRTVVHFAGNTAEAEKTVAAIVAAGGDAFAVRANVADEKEVTAMFNQTLDRFGRLDAVVHSAGIMPMSPIVNGDFQIFDRCTATNLRGAYIVMSRSAEHVAAGGRIVVFSSSVVGLSLPGYGPYVASKAGVEALVRVLANELRGRRVSVNSVAPGPIPTDLFLKGKSEEEIEKFRKWPPLERLGTPEDIANVVSFLCGPDGGWINGQLLRANGGLT